MESNNAIKNILKKMLSKASEIITDRVSDFAKKETEIVMETIREKVREIEKNIAKRASGAILILVSLIFFAIALSFFFIEFLMLPAYSSLAIVGGLLLIIGLLLRKK